jgi:hypothetical protein
MKGHLTSFVMNKCKPGSGFKTRKRFLTLTAVGKKIF